MTQTFASTETVRKYNILNLYLQLTSKQYH